MANASLAQQKRTVPEEARARVARGLVLYRERGEEIEALGHGRYSVPSCSGEKRYTVDLGLFHDEPGRESCTCPDFRRHKELSCKHLVAATLYRAKVQRRRWEEQREAFERRHGLEHVGDIAERVLGNLV